MATKHGLGRGLGALIQDIQDDPVSGNSLNPNARNTALNIPVEKIVASPFQPRRSFEPEALNDLVRSIQAHGILQPLMLRKVGDGYELVAGERRLRAARQAGLETVPAFVRDLSDSDSLAIGLIENLQREDLNVMEEAEGYQRLADQFGLTQEDIARSVGKARATIANAMRLLELPKEIKQLLSAGSLSAGHAKALMPLTLDQEKCLLARQAVKEGLSVRFLEKLVTRIQRAPRKPRAGKFDVPGEHLRHLTDKLHHHFGSNVRIMPSKTLANGKKAKGSIEIDFYSNEDLNRILDILGISDDI